MESNIETRRYILNTEDCYEEVPTGQRAMAYSEKGKSFCREIISQLEKGDLSGPNLKSICREMVQATMPRFTTHGGSGSLSLTGDTEEKAPVVPGIQVLLKSSHSDPSSNEQSSNEFSSLPQYVAQFNAKTMIPKYDIEDAVTYIGRKNKPSQGSQSPIEQIDTITRSSIKNINSFAQRSKEFSKAAQEANLDKYRNLTEFDTETKNSRPNDTLSSFSSSPDEFLSPYESMTGLPQNM